MTGRITTASDVLTGAFVIGMFGLAVLAYGAVPAQMTVHYTPPGGVYYGLETLPKTVGLFLLPVVGAFVVAALRCLPLVDGIGEAVRGYYQASIVATAGCLCLGQVAVVAINVV